MAVPCSRPEAWQFNVPAVSGCNHQSFARSDTVTSPDLWKSMCYLTLYFFEFLGFLGLVNSMETKKLKKHEKMYNALAHDTLHGRYGKSVTARSPLPHGRKLCFQTNDHLLCGRSRINYYKVLARDRCLPNMKSLHRSLNIAHPGCRNKKNTMLIIHIYFLKFSCPCLHVSPHLTSMLLLTLDRLEGPWPDTSLQPYRTFNNNNNLVWCNCWPLPAP